MIETAKLHCSRRPAGGAKTITIRPSGLQPHGKSQQPQQIIVIPQSMLVNGCISSKDLKSIMSTDSPASPTSIKSMENRTDLKRPASSVDDSTYGSDSEGSEDSDKPARKRANLDHLSPDEKLMRRKLKNRVAAQNARDKKRVKMEDMELELQRLTVISNHGFLFVKNVNESFHF